MLVVVTSDQVLALGDDIQHNDHATFDVGAAVQNMALQASELGLAFCVIGGYDEDQIRSLTNCPKKLKIEVMIAIGVPSFEGAGKSSRKPMDEIVSHGAW